MKKLIFTGVLSLSVFAGAQSEKLRSLCDGFVPENNIKIPVGATFRGKVTGITEAQFNSVLDRMAELYTVEVKGHGAKYMINRHWTDGTVNAYATQQGSEWQIDMFGGLARYNGMTEDGFAAVACHETGHHLGGAPKFADADWGTVEGGADYYTSLKCLRRYFDKDDNEKIIAGMKLDPVGVKTCEAQWVNRHDQVVCIRAVEAGIVLGRVLQDLGGEAAVHLDTPDKAVVSQTDEAHPAAQCRLDTYFNGSLCSVPVSQLQDNKDPKTGSCWDAKLTPHGLRPHCWFKP